MRWHRWLSGRVKTSSRWERIANTWNVKPLRPGCSGFVRVPPVPSRAKSSDSADMLGPDSNSPPADEAGARRVPSRIVLLDRSLESLPLFRLSDSSDAGPVVHVPEAGGRWRVLPAPGDRLPGTFDQDVYVEVCRRFHESGAPADGGVTFTLHALLRSIGRRADGRTYEQLRGALVRLERTTLESVDAYWSASSGRKEGW